jgi:hypothetical protein
MEDLVSATLRPSLSPAAYIINSYPCFVSTNNKYLLEFEVQNCPIVSRFIGQQTG